VGPKDHLRLLQTKIDDGLETANLSQRQRQDYRAVLESILGNLRPAALARLHDFVREFKFY
jgi:hypothetical protein